MTIEKSFQCKLVPFCAVLFFTFNIVAQSDSKEKGSFTIVTNPAYFVLGSYLIKPSYHFPKRWSIGATLQGGFELPEFTRDQFFDFSDLLGNDLNDSRLLVDVAWGHHH